MQTSIILSITTRSLKLPSFALREVNFSIFRVVQKLSLQL